MRTLTCFLAAIACVALGPLAYAQQLPNFKPGDAVDFYTFGKWSPCTVASALVAGAYNVRCGSLELRAKADPHELRMHITSPLGVQAAFGVESASAPPQDMSVGARYGTRDPRDCNRHPDHFTAAEARDVFICDAEHEFDGMLYLVSEVSVNLSGPRPFNAAMDAKKLNIDNAEQVVELHATYNNFQCNRLPASHFDNPNNRNCNEFRAVNAAGACFRSTAGEWHCVAADPSLNTSSIGKNVGPPTLVE